MNKKEAIEHLKRIIEFYKVGDPENFDYTDKDLISIKIVLEILDKAIEYIKCGITGDLENDRAYVDENALLHILRGEDNEN